MKKRLKSFSFALKGIKSAFSTEPNMKIHGIIALLVVIFGILFQISINEWLLCLLCFGLVFGLELINTSLENIVDLVSPEIHPTAGKIKDLAAGAVLISALFSAVIGLIIFIPKIWEWLSRLTN